MQKNDKNKMVKEQKHGKTEQLHNETDGFTVRNQNDEHNVRKEIMGRNTKR